MSRLEQLKSLLARHPDDVFLNFGLAMEHRSAGEVDAALQQFDRTIQLDPNYLAAYMRKGETLMQQKRFDEARDVLTHGSTIAQAAGDTHMLDNIREMLDLLP